MMKRNNRQKKEIKEKNKKWKSNDIKKYMIDCVQIIIGSLIIAFGTSVFLLPNKLSFGGATGIATVLYYIFRFPIGNVVFIINIPLFILAYIKFGKSFCIKSVIGTLALSFFYNVLENVIIITEDKLLASIVGGIIVGLGNVIVYNSNSTTGGSDIIVKYIRKKIPRFKTGSITATVDVVIVTVNVIFLKNIEIALYSAIAIFTIGKVVDTAYEGIGFSRTIFIISKKYSEIANEINTELKRGVTGVYSKGMYTNSDNLMLLCVVGRNEVGNIRRIVGKIDPKSFMIISNTREVIGTGFNENNNLIEKSN